MSDDIPSGMERCSCAPDCDFIRCTTCGCGDCKWPGACRGKCRVCGERARSMPGYGDIFQCHCSDACMKIDEDKSRAEGRIVEAADLTVEQFNELLGKAGLAIEGVGPRRPS